MFAFYIQSKFYETLAVQSLQSLIVRLTLAVQSLILRLTLAVQGLILRLTIAVQSLIVRLTRAVQSLIVRLTHAVQSLILRLTLAVQGLIVRLTPDYILLFSKKVWTWVYLFVTVPAYNTIVKHALFPDVLSISIANNVNRIFFNTNKEIPIRPPTQKCMTCVKTLLLFTSDVTGHKNLLRKKIQ
jgi:hypothetical protein